MTAQVKRDMCKRFVGAVERFPPRPDMRERFVGDPFTPLDQPKCTWIGAEGDDVRLQGQRGKRGKPAYGKGTPRDRALGQDYWGVPCAYDGGLERLMTEQGPVLLSTDVQEPWDSPFTPSVSTLKELPYADSRMIPLSDRYFK